MSWRPGRRWWPFVPLLVACAKDAPERSVAWLVLEAADTDPDALDALDAVRVVPPEALVRAVRTGARAVVGIDVRVSGGGVEVDVPASCPVRVAASDLRAGAEVRAILAPRLALKAPAHPRDVGYAAPFVVEATLGCSGGAGAAPPAGRLAWRQLSGPPLGDVHQGGLRFEARTAPEPEDDVARRPPWGIVPVSARASGEVVLEAAWQDAAGDRSTIRRRVTLGAASRSHGLPNVAVDEGVLLSGPGWTVDGAPRGATAALAPAGPLTLLLPDAAGTWALHDARGHLLSLHAGRYDETPLDCGRSGCHGPVAAAALESPMTEALRHVAVAARPCAVGCHATGEPGAHDGGFADLARELGVVVGETAWDDLPRAARRVGGVTCLGCHGPGAIPEPSARWAILRADVCATCHDSPPTYGHVTAWRASRMARSDADPRTRAPGCAPCHTTSGFLARLRGGLDSREPPPDAQAAGIACAACHAPHEPHGPLAHAAARQSLVREVHLPAWLEGVPVSGSASVCVPCHSPITPDALVPPDASAAAIWAGRGGVDPATGAPLSAPAVHGDVVGGCTGCHGGGPPELERGRGHAFQPDSTACETCHAGAAPEVGALGRELRAEATGLLARLVTLGAFASSRGPDAVDPGHAIARRLAGTPTGRAAFDVLLVLEDPAAAAHNAPYARRLLAAAEHALDEGTR